MFSRGGDHRPSFGSQTAPAARRVVYAGIGYDACAGRVVQQRRQGERYHLSRRSVRVAKQNFKSWIRERALCSDSAYNLKSGIGSVHERSNYDLVRRCH